MRQARAGVVAIVAAVAAVVGSVFVSAGGAPSAGASPVPVRLAGGDAAATAAAVSRAGWTSSSEAVVVSATSWTDALASVSLGLPMLLATRDDLPASTRDELRRLGVRRVWVVGGAQSIGRGVRDELRSGGMALNEIAGSDRYDTAARLASAMSPSTTDVVVASGESWADAASIAAWAATRHTPIYLTERDALPSASSPARNATRAIVVGGASAISDAVADSLPNPVRLFGDDRYGTNATVVQWATGNGAGWSRPVVAPGASPIDALVAGAFAATRGSSVVLTPPERMPVSAQHLFAEHAAEVQSLAAVGGPAQVADSAMSDAVAAAESADLLGWVNAFRAANGGRAPLTRDHDMSERAFAYAVTLAMQGRLSHQSPACGSWGENVGVGASAREVFDAWSASSGHRSVMQMASVSKAGTAVFTSNDGRRWVVLDVCG
jgi:putative cell wall-binding protein/uncharacterized protein YkwD